MSRVIVNSFAWPQAGETWREFLADRMVRYRMEKEELDATTPPELRRAEHADFCYAFMVTVAEYIGTNPSLLDSEIDRTRLVCVSDSLDSSVAYPLAHSERMKSGTMSLPIDAFGKTLGYVQAISPFPFVAHPVSPVDQIRQLAKYFLFIGHYYIPVESPCASQTANGHQKSIKNPKNASRREPIPNEPPQELKSVNFEVTFFFLPSVITIIAAARPCS